MFHNNLLKRPQQKPHLNTKLEDSSSWQVLSRRVLLPVLGLATLGVSSCDRTPPKSTLRPTPTPLPTKFDITDRQRKLSLKLGYQGDGLYGYISVANRLKPEDERFVSKVLKEYFYAGEFFTLNHGKEIRDIGVVNIPAFIETFDANFFIRLTEKRSREVNRLGVDTCIELAKKTSAQRVCDCLINTPWRLIDRKENLGRGSSQAHLVNALLKELEHSVIDDIKDSKRQFDPTKPADVLTTLSLITNPDFEKLVSQMLGNATFSRLAQDIFDRGPNLSELLIDARLSDTEKRNGFKLFLLSCAHLYGQSCGFKPATIKQLSKYILSETDLRGSVPGVANSNLQFAAKELYGLPKSVLLGIAVHEFEHRMRRQMTAFEEYAGDLAAMDVVSSQFDDYAVKNLCDFLGYSNLDAQPLNKNEPHWMARTQLSRIINTLTEKGLPLDYHQFYLSSRKLEADGHFLTGPLFADFADAHIKSYLDTMTELWQVKRLQQYQSIAKDYDADRLLSVAYLRKVFDCFKSAYLNK